MAISRRYLGSTAGARAKPKEDPRAPSVAQSSCIGDGDPTGEAYGTCKRDRELRPLRGSEGQPCPAAPQLLMSPRSWHLGFQKLLGS